MAYLDVCHVTKSFGETTVLRDVCLQANRGEIVSILGPSGCGKTTLLRIIGGLEEADQGQVFFGGTDLSAEPTHRRGFGLMFQDFALFPHKDVAANIVFGLRMQGWTAEAMQNRLDHMLELVDLQGYENRQVFELSGGEQQRVALARSLAPQPELLMLDEPLGALDRSLREELMGEIRAILNRVGLTALYVTHDQEEAFVVADRVLIMREGRIVQSGEPQKVYEQPAGEFVARFLGLSNLVPGKVVSVGPLLEVSTALGQLAIDRLVDPRPLVGGPVTVVIPPGAAVSVHSEAPAATSVTHAPGCTIVGELQAHTFRGGKHRLRTRHPDGIELEFEVSAGTQMPDAGQSIWIILDPKALTILPFLDGDNTR
jgi:ABC-type Fe3+/spermidine/putrescine transport system ATPase subunit